MGSDVLVASMELGTGHLQSPETGPRVLGDAL